MRRTQRYDKSRCGLEAASDNNLPSSEDCMLLSLNTVRMAVWEPDRSLLYNLLAQLPHQMSASFFVSVYLEVFTWKSLPLSIRYTNHFTETYNKKQILHRKKPNNQSY